MRHRVLVGGLAASLAVGGLAACGKDEEPAGTSKVDVVAGFYPLQFVAERVGGAHVAVTGLAAAAGPEYRQREIRFAEPAAAVRRRLRALGTALPAPPAAQQIPTDNCAASIGIEVRGPGTALVCTGWC